MVATMESGRMTLMSKHDAVEMQLCIGPKNIIMEKIKTTHQKPNITTKELQIEKFVANRKIIM